MRSVLIAAAAVAASAGADACSSEFDCAYRGKCISGHCHCAPTWEGAQCQQLALRSASTNVAGALVRPQEWLSSWGASVVSIDGEYHMYAADFLNNCGVEPWWRRNSRIVHATAAEPEGPYVVRDQALGPFSHNPHVQRAPDGELVLYHIGSGRWSTAGPPRNCSKPSANGTKPVNPRAKPRRPVTPSQSRRPTASGRLGGPRRRLLAASSIRPGAVVSPNIVHSSSPSGPWRKVKGTPGALPCNNPAAYIFRNGTTLLYCKYAELRNAIWVAVADSWRGPYVLRGPCDGVEGEDPVVFRQPETGSFHMLLHTLNTGAKFRTTAFSKDGLVWHPAFGGDTGLKPFDAFGRSIPYDSGSRRGIVRVQRRERHQVLLDPKTGQPTHLFNGVSPPIGRVLPWYSSVQPIRTQL